MKQTTLLKTWKVIDLTYVLREKNVRVQKPIGVFVMTTLPCVHLPN